MDYQEIKDLINSTLQGKESGHEITPLEHQSMILEVLNYIRSRERLGKGNLIGFAFENTVPELSENACYVALCPSGVETIFSNFLNSRGLETKVVCKDDEVKFVILLFNEDHWDKLEQSLDMQITEIVENGDFNQDYNNDFLN